jgi:hypothetical protein
MMLVPAVVITLFAAPIHAGAGSNITVTAEGAIGTLHVDRSTRAEVLAVAGRPDSEVQGRYSDYPRFDALGYGCYGHPATTNDGVPTCTTVYYLDSRSGRLAIFYSSDRRYRNLFGVSVGTPTATAEKTLHRTVYVGCLASIRIVTKSAFLTLIFDGGRPRPIHHPAYYIALIGGRVGTIVVHSNKLNPGVLDCIDS